MRTITPTEVAALPDAAIIDVREPDEVATIRVPGATTIPMSALQERLDELPDGPLYILCHSGGRSARVTQYLEVHGYDAVNVESGIMAWHLSGLPTEP